MQTLKTAIVVVLLLTVTYSAYVALTAPTPELPAEVTSLIEQGSFDLGDIGMGEIDAGISADFASDPANGPSIDAGFPGGAGGLGGSGSPLVDADSATATLSDQGSPSPGALPGSEPASPTMAARGAPQSLPKPDPSSPGVEADPTQTYPETPYGELDLAGMGGIPAVDSDDDSIAAGPSGNETPDEGAAPDGATASQGTHPGLVNAIATADRQWENDELREALSTLSLFYNDPELQPADREPLQARLDMLAGEVIYSSRHLLEQPYRVREGDTLQTVAETYEVPWQLLANINQVKDPAAIVPGQELKIMRGPFRAEINLNRSELTLFLGELYAGRFPITVGSDPVPPPGTYTIADKQTARTYYTLTGGNIPAGDPRNPYGNVWMDLGSQVCIHGSPQTPEGEATGCIQLRTADAGDVFGILSKGSAVSIMR